MINIFKSVLLFNVVTSFFFFFENIKFLILHAKLVFCFLNIVLILINYCEEIKSINYHNHTYKSDSNYI